jgi:hypothetical protein
MLNLIEGALDLLYGEDNTASTILMRSALECYVEIVNLSRDGDDYLLVLRAVLLEGRSAIFHFKTKGLYDHFVNELGASGAAKMGKEIADQFKDALKNASDRYPILRYNTRNLTILNRFRIADMEDRYHSEYTWLSMQAHNALEPLLIDEGMRRAGAAMDEAQDGVGQATVIHFAMGLLVDTVKWVNNMFGADDAFTGQFLSLLEKVAQDEAVQ